MHLFYYILLSYRDNNNNNIIIIITYIANKKRYESTKFLSAKVHQIDAFNFIYPNLKNNSMGPCP